MLPPFRKESTSTWSRSKEAIECREAAVEIMLSPLESAEGILVTAAICDISVREAAEEHLGHMEGRYRGLLEAAPDAMVVVNTAGDESLAGQALQEGAQDYLIRGQIDTRGLLRALRYAVERKNMEEALFVEKERAEVRLNCIGDAVACTDIAGNITFPQSGRGENDRVVAAGGG
jgi:PAS domain-containing protein